jgi:VWFA-related protein
MFRPGWILGFAVTLAYALQAPPDGVLRITVNLVQVDAVVTDSHGDQVTNLTQDDFEILEDGRPRQITAFSYVRAATAQASGARQPAAHAKNQISPPAPAASPITREQVRRTVVLTVDDLGLSFESTYSVRRALKNFVDEQMREGDLVAIIRTSAGMGSLQQFTADKRILHAAIDQVRWYPMGRAGVSAVAPLESDSAETAVQRRPLKDLFQEQPALEEERANHLMAGTLGAVNFVVRSLRDLPGRKAVILFSDGLRLVEGRQNRSPILDPMRSLIDLANRSATILYAIDVRGLQTLNLTAADNPSVSGKQPQDPGSSPGSDSYPQKVAAAMSRRSREYIESQHGLAYLAEQTGGFLLHDNNDLAGGVRRALADLSGYYLIGYKPDESSFAAPNGDRRFHKIQVKVKLNGLHVRSRSGYLGVPDEEAGPLYGTRVEQLRAALVSPFGSGDLKLRLTCLFSEVPKKGAVVHSLLSIDARDFTYTGEPDGSRKTVLDLVGLAFDEQGTIVGSINRTVRMRLTPQEYLQAMQAGFLYTLDLTLAKAGPYQVRVAVRDAASEKVGSASQFMEIPDVRKHRLTLSGIVLKGVPRKASGKTTAEPPENAALASEGSPAVRIFQPGAIISYECLIFNARTKQKTNLAELETQLLLYHDSKPVYTGPVTRFETSEQTGLGLVASGALRLGPNLEPGEYALQLVTWDKLAPPKSRLATQWTDLEIVR